MVRESATDDEQTPPDELIGEAGSPEELTSHDEPVSQNENAEKNGPDDQDLLPEATADLEVEPIQTSGLEVEPEDEAVSITDNDEPADLNQESGSMDEPGRDPETDNLEDTMILQSSTDELPPDDETTANDYSAVCSSCGKENRQGAVFCSGCGSDLTAAMNARQALPHDQPLTEEQTPHVAALPIGAMESSSGPLFCRVCGAGTKPGSRFCKGCGAALQGAGAFPDPTSGAPVDEGNKKTEQLLPFAAAGALVLALIVAIGSYLITRDTGPSPDSPVPVGPTEPGPGIQKFPSDAFVMFRGNAQHTGTFDAQIPEELTEYRWKFKTMGEVFSSPALSEGRVFVGSKDQNIYALDASTGVQKWKFTTGGMIDSSPTAAGGSVFFGSKDHNFYSVDANTGAENWRFMTGAEIDCPPAIADGIVYFGSADTKMYALDAATGTMRWEFKTGGGVVSPAAVDNGVVYFGSKDGHLFALDALDGTEKWRFKVGDAIDSSPAIAEGTVFFGSNDRNLYALEAATGQEKWRFTSGHSINASPTVDSGVVYFGSNDHNFYALDTSDGSERWKFTTGDGIFSSSAIAEGIIYFGGKDSKLYALDASNGEEKWEYKTGARIQSSPALAGGTVYFGSADGNLYRLGEGDGTPPEPPVAPEPPAPAPQTPAPAPSPQQPPDTPVCVTTPLPVPGPVAAPDIVKTFTVNNSTNLSNKQLLVTGSGSTPDLVAQGTHDNAYITYDYFRKTFGRDSFDGKQGGINAVVHYGRNYNNAYWDGRTLVFGDCDGINCSSPGRGLDVVAHEYSHAVVQYSTDLIYRGQSGALNESFADVFGAMVDRDDWLMGEDVWTPCTPGDALRSLENPTLYDQPDNMKDYVNTSSDNGGVHTNSGIPNKAAYNIAVQIGREKVEQIWYRALTYGYMTESATFADARDACVLAAGDLYGKDSVEVAQVKNGFAAVGIGKSAPVPVPVPVPTTRTTKTSTTPTTTAPTPTIPADDTPTVLGDDAMFMAGPSHTGEYDGGGTVPDGDIKWKFDTKGMTNSSAAVSGNRVYFAAGDSLYGVDITDGENYWKAEGLGTGIVSPAVADGKVYTASGSKNILYAMDATNGKELWKSTVAAKVTTNITVADGVVYFGGDDSYYYAVDGNTGKEKWKFKTGYQTHVTPSVADGVVYFGGGWSVGVGTMPDSIDKYLYAVDAATGKEKWKVATAAGVDGTPAISDGAVFFGGWDGIVYAMDTKTGKQQWTFKPDGYLFPNVAVAKGVVYLEDEDSEKQTTYTTYSGRFNDFYAIDAKTGKKKWKIKTGRMLMSDEASGSIGYRRMVAPAVADGVAYFGSFDRNLYAVDAATGVEKWKYETSRWLNALPTVADGVVYFGAQPKAGSNTGVGGTLYALK
jgi:outer membrane protein assembly factor BamB